MSLAPVPASYIHPEVLAIVPGIMDAVRQEFGDLTEKIVLLGSAIRPGDFIPGRSDVDVCVLLSTFPGFDGHPSSGLMAQALSELNHPVSVGSRLRADIEPLCNFELSYEGAVARGVVLFDSGRPYEGLVLSRAEAKAATIQRFIQQAREAVRTAKYLSRSPRFDFVPRWEACRAACQILHAVLAEHYVDFTPKALRWQLMPLFSVAVGLEPSLEGLWNHIKALPHDVAPLERQDLYLVGLEDKSEPLPVVARAMLCVRIISSCVEKSLAKVERIQAELAKDFVTISSAESPLMEKFGNQSIVVGNKDSSDLDWYF